MQIDRRDENQPIRDLLKLLLLHCVALFLLLLDRTAFKHRSTG